MTTESELTGQRTEAQRLREETERRERTVVDLRMVYATLEDRLDRVRRDADPERSDERIASHLDRLLDRHRSGRRPLAYLGEAVGEIDIEERAEQRLERLDRPDHDPGEFGDGDFDAALVEFFEKVAEGDDERETRRVVRESYRTLLTEGDETALTRALVLVGVVLDAADLALTGGEEVPVTGVRTELEDVLGAHVGTLERTDDRLVGADELDPFVALDWTDPVAMLPVRLETRFREDVIQVRAYPEQIHVDAHEDQLTEDERRWGEAFWTQLWVAGVPDTDALLTADGEFDETLLPDERAVDTAVSLLEQFDAGAFSPEPGRRFDEVRERVWAQGTERFGEERAGYVVAALEPVDAASGAAVGEQLREGWTEDGGPTAPLSGAVAIEFPDVDVRPESWTRTPTARLLPDRFVADAYYDADDAQSLTTDWREVEDGVYERRAGEEFIRRATGGPVAEPLPVGPSPEAVAADGDGDGATEAAAPEEMAWMTDFDEALRVGMALELPLPDPDATPYSEAEGFSRLVVTGAKTSMDAAASRAALADLLDASHYTDGLELLAPGTPTNNADEPSGRSTRRDPAESVGVEAGAPLAGPGTDGRHLADAFGVDPDVFAHVAGAGDTRETDARAANRALWPATLGYYVRNLPVPDESDDRGPPGLLGTGESETGEGPPSLLRWLETYRDHFVDHVRAAGPVQTLRVGDQPYGVLPVSPLDVTGADRVDAEMPKPPEPAESGDDWAPAPVPRVPDGEFVPELVERSLALRERWLRAADRVPSVADDPALPEDDLLSMLAMEATAGSYRRQLWLLGDDNPLYDFVGDPDHTEVRREVRKLLQSAHLPETTPRIANLLFLGVSLTSDNLPVTDEDVATFVDTVVDLFAANWPDLALRVLGTDPDQETFRLSATAPSEWPRDLVLRLLDPSTDPGDYDPTASLLRQLVRFAALQAAIASRVRLGAMYGGRTNEYAEFPAEPTAYGPGDPTVFQLFDDTIPPGTAFTGAPPLIQHPDLNQSADFRDVFRATAAASGSGFGSGSGVGSGAGSGTPAPDPALGGFLDALAHLTTVDPERLGRLTTETTDLTSHRLDAWWMSLATRRLREHRAAAGDGLQVAAFGFVEDLSRGSGPDAEYLLAPSIDQATTASVLRSAHKARANGDDPAAADALAIDCSAAQIKRARPLLEGVRNGLDLAELLGYRFERGLREAGGDGLDLEQYIDDFRTFAPAVAGKLGRSDTEDSTKQSDVVDGREVYRAWKEGRLWTAPEISLSDAEKRALGGKDPDADEDGVLKEIDAAMDAVHDVLVAEGVHHLAHGRPERAAQALEALSRGETPPEPTVVDTPRSETGVTHRLMLLFGDANSHTQASGWRSTMRSLLDSDDFPDRDGSGGGNGNGGGNGGGGDGGGESNDGSSDAPTMEAVQVRHEGEPAVDAWAGELLPTASRIGCTAEFQWERDRDFAVGRFETPAESGTVTVAGVGFEPDALLVTAVAGATGDGATATDAVGWSHGAFRRAAGDYPAVQRATSAAVTPDGTVDRTESTTNALVVEFPGGDGGPFQVAGRVAATTDDGFELDCQVSTPADGPDRVMVRYRALQLADPTSVRVGTLTTPAATGATESVDLSGAGPSDDFDPDHVLFAAALPGDVASGAPTALGFSHGEVLRGTDGALTQQTLGYGVAPAAADYRVAARDDAVVEATPGSGAAVRLSVEDLPGGGTAEIRAGDPGSGYAGAVPVTYVAVESPTVDTPAGPERRRPAVGAVVAPANADETTTVETGFRPALVEARFAVGVTGDGVDDLPVEASVGPADAGFSLGAATGRGVQGSLATGVTADAGSASAADAIGQVPTTGPDGATAGASVSVAAVTDEGFDLSFGNLDGDRPLVFYRAWPEQPDAQGFVVEFPGGVGLDDLKLTALDAVSLTQGVDAAGDSQLERRIGYYAFRHRPDNRPPVPGDAALDLSFSETPPGHDVSVGEYVEVARSIDDLVGEARPADATDLTHPGDAGDKGYLDASAPGGATASRLADRAAVVEERLADVEAILADRVELLDQDPNVCDRVEALETALRRFRREAPVSQITELTDRLERDHPGNTHRAVENTVLAELRTVAEYVRTGPNDADGVELVVTDEADRTVSDYADVSGATDLVVTAYSLSDGHRFDPKTTRVTTDDEGAFEATFDFDGVPVGTEFTVVATPADAGDGSGDTLEEALETFLERLDLAGRLSILVQLAAEEVYEPPDELAESERFVELVENVRAELDDGRRPLAVFRDLHEVLRRELGHGDRPGDRFRDRFGGRVRDPRDWRGLFDRDGRLGDRREGWPEVDEDVWRDLLEGVEDAGRERFAELVAALADDVLLDRTFEEPRPDDWTFVDEPPRTTRTSEWTFSADAGELRQTSNIYGFAGPDFEAPGTLAVVGDREWTDYRITARMTSEDDDAIGVVFRYQDPDNFYRFSMDAQREYRRLVRKVDGEPELLWEDETGFDPGRAYRMTVECVGSTLTGALDGEQLFSVRDDGLDRGAVGLYCRANENARFHDVRVVGRSQPSRVLAGEKSVYAADCRVVDADDEGGWRDLPAVVADQRYLPQLLWLARVLPDVEPRPDGPAGPLAAAVGPVSWDTPEGVGPVPWDTAEVEHALMSRVLTVLKSGAGDPQAFDDDDLAAVVGLLDLRRLDLARLAEAVAAAIGPAAWTGLTDLVALTGDRARPDAQRPWRAGDPSPETLVEKDPEGEVRARLERLRSFPRTDARPAFAAYSPPVRELLAEGRLDADFVETVEACVADPAGVVEAAADAAPGVVDLVAGLHDLLHHVESFDSADRVGDLRAAAVAFEGAIDGADAETAERLDERSVDAEALADGLATYESALEDAIRDYLTGPTTADQVGAYVSAYAGDLTRASDAATRELGRVLAATGHPDLTAAFRTGVLESLRRGLLRASYFGVYGSVPAAAAGGSAADEETLVDQARRVGAEVRDRKAASQALGPGGPDPDEPTVEGQVDRFQALLGDEFVVLPPFAPSNPVELHGTLTDPDLLEDPYATDTWLQRIARVRDLPKSFQRVRTYADALAMAGGSTDRLRRTLEVGQLPHVPGQDWLGQDGVTPGGGELSLGIEFANEYGGQGPLARTPGQGAPGVAGLLVDEWIERVPDERETVGLGLQYDDPSARAPQSVVLATPPTWRVDREEGAGIFVTDEGPTKWTDALVQESLTELRELIRMRAVDLDALNGVGHLLPMLCFPDNRETLLDRGAALPDAPSVALDDFTWELF